MALVPKYIQHLAPYKAGIPVEQLAREKGLTRIVKLASNENPLGPSPRVLEAVRKSLEQSHRYPDSSAFELRTALAKRYALQLGNVIVGAGSEGIMSTIMRTFLLENDELIAAENSFIGFRVLAHASGRKICWVPMQNYSYNLPAMADEINEHTKLIYLANPDNPTGSIFTANEFDTFMARVPERVLIILDEAYFEYAKHLPDYPDSMHYRYDNVITLRTFSKAYGLAGLRIGYGFAQHELIGNLLKVKLPFEPSRPAQVAALAALDDSAYLEQSLTTHNANLAQLLPIFDELGLQYIPTAANFVTLIFASADEATRFTNQLLDRGVILRHLVAFGWPNLVRVTIGSNDENEFFVQQIRAIQK